jgi:hypothetical protein
MDDRGRKSRINLRCALLRALAGSGGIELKGRGCDRRGPGGVARHFRGFGGRSAVFRMGWGGVSVWHFMSLLRGTWIMSTLWGLRLVGSYAINIPSQKDSQSGGTIRTGSGEESGFRAIPARSGEDTFERWQGNRCLCLWAFHFPVELKSSTKAIRNGELDQAHQRGLNGPYKTPDIAKRKLRGSEIQCARFN